MTNRATARNLEYLTSHIGRACVEWLLGDVSTGLTEGQAKVVSDAVALIKAWSRRQPDIPIELIVQELGYYNPAVGMSPLNYLRQGLSGPTEDRQPQSPDRVLDALMTLVCVEYCQLLLPRSTMDFRLDFRQPEVAAFVQAIRDDPTLPSTSPNPDFDGFLESSTAERLILTAWELERLEDEVPTLSRVLARLGVVLGSAREAFAGRVIAIKQLVSLSGIVMEPGARVTTPWGRIRPAHDWDHPRVVKGLAASKTIGSTGDQGEKVTISDAGDVILEADIPARVIFREVDAGYNMTLKPRIDTESLVLEARLALLLSMTREPLSVVPVWWRTIDPLISAGRLASWQNPQSSAPRTPTQLSQAEVDRWLEWIGTIHSIKLKRLGVGPTRLLRAVAERRNNEDALVDAVIAWEALFGEDQEITFKASTCIARLLGETAADRRTLRKRAVDIYRMRSKVVHGGDVPPSEIEAARTEAIAMTIRVLAKLIGQRQDLINLTSGERIVALTME